MKLQRKSVLELTYNSHRWCIGVTEFDENGYGVRTYTLATQEPYTVTSVMLRRFDHMARLMKGNVEVRMEVWQTEEEAADEADHRNSTDCNLEDHETWQSVAINDGNGDLYWSIMLSSVEVD